MYKNAADIRECFDKLGSWIVSCHGKDLVWEDYVQVCLREVVPGRGQIHYKTYLTELCKLPVGAPLMLEQCQTAEEYDEGRRFVEGVARELGFFRAGRLTLGQGKPAWLASRLGGPTAMRTMIGGSGEPRKAGAPRKCPAVPTTPLPARRAARACRPWAAPHS
jgi:hypothetical protein